jgi:nucleoside-diphosphate-sugar epimerase
MRVAVTGGAGFIGHHVVSVLVARGHSVVVLDNLRRGSFERPGLDRAMLIDGDIRDETACRSAFAGADAVVHLAAQANVMGSQADADYAFTTNVAGTWAVARAAAAAGARHLIFASSREVYGEPETFPVAESAPLRAKNLYGATKVSGEAILGALPGGMPNVSILRLANVVGTGDCDRVVPRWVAAARCGRPLVLYGGEQVLDFVPVATVVEAVLRLLELGPTGAPINVGSGRPTTLRELATRVLADVRADAGIEIRPPRAIEVTRFVADTTRLKNVLGVSSPEDPLAGLAGFGG